MLPNYVLWDQDKRRVEGENKEGETQDEEEGERIEGGGVPRGVWETEVLSHRWMEEDKLNRLKNDGERFGGGLERQKEKEKPLRGSKEH